MDEILKFFHLLDVHFIFGYSTNYVGTPKYLKTIKTFPFKQLYRDYFSIL